MFKSAIIGYGYWGEKLARIFNQVSQVNVICDLNQKNLNRASVNYNCNMIENYSSIKRSQVDLAVVGTTSSSHAEIVEYFLKNNIHVWVEKPATLNSFETRRLADLACANNLVLMVDHTFCYHPAIERIKTIDIGKKFYYDSRRTNLGIFRNDIDVVWDLAIHDLSILEYLIKQDPKNVQVNKSTYIGQQPSSAHIHLEFPNNFNAHIHVDWVSPIKNRKITLAGENKIIEFDDLLATEKLKVHDYGQITDKSSMNNLKVNTQVISLDETEVLLRAANHFIECVKYQRKPITDGYSASRIQAWVE